MLNIHPQLGIVACNSISFFPFLPLLQHTWSFSSTFDFIRHIFDLPFTLDSVADASRAQQLTLSQQHPPGKHLIQDISIRLWTSSRMTLLTDLIALGQIESLLPRWLLLCPPHC